MGDTNGGRPRYARPSASERALFLKVLGETGSRRAAAAAIGVEPRLMDQRREHDPELDRDWKAAVEEAHRGLSAANGPFDCPQDGKLNMIRPGRNGRLQLVAAGMRSQARTRIGTCHLSGYRLPQGRARGLARVADDKARRRP